MKHAFSLVELSIVLVILGLLVGGLLIGQDLIRAAELRSIPVEFNKYQTAITTFRTKYFALPGDMDNATNFWGAADTSGGGGECGDPQNDLGTGTQTCNGNGNGMVVSPEQYEWFRAWQHLSNAGLVEGRYTGIFSPTTGNVEAGYNVPKSKVNPAGWFFLYNPSYSGDANLFDGFYGHNMRFEGRNSGGSSIPVLEPREALSVDEKIDDGSPAYGNVVVYKSAYMANCATTDVSATSEYDTSITDRNCGLIMKMGF